MRSSLLNSAVLIGLAGSVHAQTTWNPAAADQNWTNAANWSAGVPGANSRAFINTGTGNTPVIATAVDKSASVGGNDLWIGSGAGVSGRLDINNAGSLNTSGTWMLLGHNGGTGTLNVNTGGSLTSNADIRVGRRDNTGFAQGIGTINVDGGALAVDSIVNENAAANAFNFSNAASVTTLNDTALRNIRLTNLTGAVNLQGGDQRLAAGASNISSGGSFAASGQVMIGDTLTGALTVNAGAGGVTSNSWFVVGIGTNGNGTLNVESGTVTQNAANRFFTIGANSNAVGVINQTGGTVIDKGNDAGNYGMYLGEGGTGAGTYNLSGGELQVSRIRSGNGNGRLNLDGGTLRALQNDTTFIGANVDVDVRSNGGKIHTGGFNVTSLAAIDGAGITQGTGSLEILGGGTMTAGTINLTGDVTLNGSRLLVTDTATAANIIVGDGSTLGAGDAAATLTGNVLIAAGGKLDVSLGLLTMASSGTLSFGGFGFDDLVGFDVNTAVDGIYTLISGDFTLDSAGLENYGEENALMLDGGRKAYFDQGSLNVVVIPEPSAWLLGGLGFAGLALRRSRQS